MGGGANPAAVWTSQKGKILRFTAEGLPAPGNPHYATGATNEEKRVWARGFRNPWTMAVDPVSGRIFTGDVGDGTEEINEVTAPDAAKGHWYGYGVGGGDGVRNNAGMIDPIYYHPTGGQGECAIVASAPYNAAQVSNWPAEYRNKIYVADYCGNNIRTVPLAAPDKPADIFAAGQVFQQNSSKKVGLNIGIDGNLYYVAYGNAGKAIQVSYNGPTAIRAPSAPVIEVANFVFRLGQATQVRFSLNGGASASAASGAGPVNGEFAILSSDGRELFRQRVVMDGNVMSAEGFRPVAAGLHVCRLSWNEAGAERQALGRLVVLP